MRRRLATVLTAALLGSVLLLPAAAVAAPATGSVATEAIPLAASGPDSTEGPDPMEPDASENEFAPQDYEANVTWRANNYLFILVALVAAGTGLLYYLKVGRFQRKSRQS